MSRNHLLAFGVSGAIAISAVIAARDADAIPAFARKYQLSCSTCHAPFPRLKPFGEEFAARGYRMEDKSKEPSRATYDVGDPLLKLVRDLPLAVRLEGYASWKENTLAESDAEWPWVFKFLSGGPITDNISYFFYFLEESGEVVGLEDAFVQFNSIFRMPLDLAVGQYQVCDVLFKRELRLERYDYDVLTAMVGQSDVNLTYNRGLALTWHAPAEIDVVFQVFNGNGIGPADSRGNFDNDRQKDFSLRLVRQFGNVRAGLFSYSGKQRNASTGRFNTTTYFGPDLVVDLGKSWNVSLEYLERRDDNPFFSPSGGPSFVTRGGFAEVTFFPNGQDGRWVLTALYNKVNSDDPAAEAESASLTANYLLARNVRVTVEGGRDLVADASRITVGLVTAF
jgi:hypothetical protein